MSPEERKEIDGIKQELALFQLNQMKKNEELQENIDARSHLGAINLLEARIKILEEARQRQIKLNEEQINANTRFLELLKVKPNIDKPKWKWW